MTRILIGLSCVALLVTVACSGGSPASPTAAGATITGTVLRAASTPSTLTVSVTGTKLSSPVDASGAFQLGGVPTGDVQLVFGGSETRSTVSLSNVQDKEVIELQVAIVGGTATVEREVRGNSPGKVVLCHREDDGQYHSIDVSVNAEPAHRAHGDARPGEPVPGDSSKVFDDACRVISPVEIRKLTNGQDVDQAPGPAIPVGSPVSWTYVITNRSALTLTSLSVTDDRGVTVTCPKELPAPGSSVTCTGSGTAVAGQYRNVGTVVATAGGTTYTASDVSYYFGGVPEETQKVQLCHRTGNGSYHLIEVSVSAEAAHRAHGDGKVGEAVPGSPGRVFTESCGVR